jgi:hypothetical protein
MIEAWWNSLGLALQVYYLIAIITSFVLLIQLVLMLFGFDGDADVDLDTDLDAHDSGMGILSVRSVTAFLTGFGWGGVVALRQGLSVVASTAVATLCGAALMATVLVLMRLLYGMRYEGTLDYRNAIGVVGSVYLPIPGAMAGPGQVEVLVQGRLAVVQAFTRAARRLPNRERVRVVDTLDPTTLIVEPLTHDLAASSSAAVPPADAGTT